MSDDDLIRRGDAVDRLTELSCDDNAHWGAIIDTMRTLPAVVPAPTPHDYQPSMNPNDQGECVICGGGPHTRIGAKPAPTLAEALDVLPQEGERANVQRVEHCWPEKCWVVRWGPFASEKQAEAMLLALRRIAEGRA